LEFGNVHPIMLTKSLKRFEAGWETLLTAFSPLSDASFGHPQLSVLTDCLSLFLCTPYVKVFINLEPT